MQPLSRKHYLAYVCICLIWGSTWSAIRLLVRDVPPFRAAAIRFALAAAVLLIVCFMRRQRLAITPRQWSALAILGVTMMGLPYGLLFWAEFRISSSLTAVLFSSCPLVVALFTPLMTHAPVPRRAVLALLIALGSLATLFYSGLSASLYLLEGGLAVVAAVILSGWSAVFAKRELGSINPLLSTAAQFVVSAAVLGFGSVLFERNRPSDWNRTSVMALLFLTIFGSVIAFSLYYWLLKTMQAYQLSTTNLIVPVIAMAEGALLLRESVPLLMVGAAVLVLICVAMVLREDGSGDLQLFELTGHGKTE